MLLGTRLGGFYYWRLEEVLVLFDNLLFRFLPAIEAATRGTASLLPVCSAAGATAYFFIWLFDIVVAIVPDPIFFFTFTIF